MITDNLSSHHSKSTREWLQDHPRVQHAFIPVGACWLNLQEAWWRIFRRHAIAGQCFADPDDITYATRLATAQLNTQAKPWVWGRPPRPHAGSSTRFEERSNSETVTHGIKILGYGKSHDGTLK